MAGVFCRPMNHAEELHTSCDNLPEVTCTARYSQPDLTLPQLARWCHSQSAVQKLDCFSSSTWGRAVWASVPRLFESGAFRSFGRNSWLIPRGAELPVLAILRSRGSLRPSFTKSFSFVRHKPIRPPCSNARPRSGVHLFAASFDPGPILRPRRDRT